MLIAGGVDFGEAVLLPEAGFPECGALCRGCLSTYERDRERLEAEAYGASYDHTDYDLKHPLAAALADWAIALIVAAVLVAAAVAAAVAARAVAWACPEFVARHPRLCVLQRCCSGGGGGAAKHDAVELQRFAAEHGAPTGWTEAEVAVFFNEIGLGRYRRQLAKNAVDGATLCDIVASGGLRDLGVSNIVHQARIRKAARLRWRGGGAAAAANRLTAVQRASYALRGPAGARTDGAKFSVSSRRTKIAGSAGGSPIAKKIPGTKCDFLT